MIGLWYLSFFYIRLHDYQSARVLFKESTSNLIVAWGRVGFFDWQSNNITKQKKEEIVKNEVIQINSALIGVLVLSWSLASLCWLPFLQLWSIFCGYSQTKASPWRWGIWADVSMEDLSFLGSHTHRPIFLQLQVSVQRWQKDLWLWRWHHRSQQHCIE